MKHQKNLMLKDVSNVKWAANSFYLLPDIVTGNAIIALFPKIVER
jgi:hypothetical protein